MTEKTTKFIFSSLFSARCASSRVVSKNLDLWWYSVGIHSTSSDLTAPLISDFNADIKFKHNILLLLLKIILLCNSFFLILYYNFSNKISVIRKSCISQLYTHLYLVFLSHQSLPLPSIGTVYICIINKTFILLRRLFYFID